MIAIVKKFFHKALFEENKKYMTLFTILFILVVESIICIVYTASNGWDKIISSFSSKEEICQKIETDITNIVGDSNDILSINLSEFEKRLFNVNFEYNSSTGNNDIVLSYPKEEVNAKIKQTNNGIKISVFKDADIWFEIVITFVLFPIILFCFLGVIITFIIYK